MIEPEGGWDGLIEIFEAVPAIAQNMAEDMMDDLADEMVRTLYFKITAQTLRLAPLSSGYLAWKRRKGLDTRILIATQDYLNAIKGTKPERPYGRGMTYQPGEALPHIRTWTVAPPKGDHGPSGLSYEALARRLEFGVVADKLPPRPHWRPAFRQTVKGAKFVQDMMKLGHKVDRELRKYLRSRKRG